MTGFGKTAEQRAKDLQDLVPNIPLQEIIDICRECRTDEAAIEILTKGRDTLWKTHQAPPPPSKDAPRRDRTRDGPRDRPRRDGPPPARGDKKKGGPAAPPPKKPQQFATSSNTPWSALSVNADATVGRPAPAAANISISVTPATPPPPPPEPEPPLDVETSVWQPDPTSETGTDVWSPAPEAPPAEPEEVEPEEPPAAPEPEPEAPPPATQLFLPKSAADAQPNFSRFGIFQGALRKPPAKNRQLAAVPLGHFELPLETPKEEPQPKPAPEQPPGAPPYGFPYMPYGYPPMMYQVPVPTDPEAVPQFPPYAFMRPPGPDDQRRGPPGPVPPGFAGWTYAYPPPGMPYPGPRPPQQGQTRPPNQGYP